ncbi:HAMP domain-containing histidine kinase [Sphingomonas sp. BT-65]|uniref:sensor histidine kinase n=1 Tax=Sphingomonas sp. BT-65 TaxID=2989821 RepID=UPI00223605CE|nr:HAMP domain-containing sensor histidine kinase [Sphingomonas sp. BT-65]MCW4463583.1 HAMP domain-containing histidine kinase [Sphingomonas sp. BT-65]
MIARLKAVAKRHWPALSLRTILLATFLLVAALPGVGAVFLRVYENTLVQQTEAELVAQGAVLASATGIAWRDAPRGPRAPQPEPPAIDLRSDPVLSPQPRGAQAGPADPAAIRVGLVIAPIVADAAATTLAATRLLDAKGVVVVGQDDIGLSYAALPEVRRALSGQVATVLRSRDGNAYGMRSPLRLLSRAAGIRVHHVRPVIVNNRVVGAVMLSRTPRGLFVGIYQDRGKIALGVMLILLALVVLAALLSRGIARPIQALAAASAEVARGGASVPDTPATAAIEIRELYANFAAMAQRVDQRTRYLRDFATAMSHEFKTPLTGIRGALELLIDHDATMRPEQRRRFLDNAMADTDRLSRLVGRLLDLSRADLAIATENPQSDVVAVIHDFRSEAETADLSIQLYAPSDPVLARVLPETLTAVLATLAENSRQAGATSIRIWISTSDTDAWIDVIDNGEGIAASDRDRIFEAFFTGRRAQGGTGLGLSIAASLLGVTGGKLSLRDTKDGATFRISIPRVAVAE